MDLSPYQRLELFWQSKGLKNASAFADTVPGLTPAALSAMKKRGNLPSSPMMRAIQSAYPDINPDYILGGTGDMLKEGRSLTPAYQLPPQVPSKFEEAEPGKQIMIVSHSLEKMLAGMTDAQKADYWRNRYETDIEQAHRREQDLLDRLAKKLDASSDAAAYAPFFESTVAAPRMVVHGVIRYPESAAHYSINGQLLEKAA